MRSKFYIVFFLVSLLYSCGNSHISENEIIVFCAASLTPVVEQLKIYWEKDHEEKIVINAASSGTLARQIENGAPADIFLSANQDWMDYLIHAMPIENHPKIIASNSLAVVAPLDSELDSMDFANVIPILKSEIHKISMGDSGHVPLGKYTKESLDYYRFYTDLTSKLILTKDARSALRLVELGEASAGFVYLSDAINSNKVQIISLVPEQSHSKIVYLAVLIESNNSEKDRLFEFLTSEKVQGIWSENGFKK